MRGWKRSRISELKSAAGIATNLGVLLRIICAGSLLRSNLTNSDELIAHIPIMGLVLAVASRIRVGNGSRVYIIALRSDHSLDGADAPSQRLYSPHAPRR